MITFSELRKSYKYFKNELQTNDKAKIFNAMVTDFTASDQINPFDYAEVGHFYVRVSLYRLIAWLY